MSDKTYQLTPLGAAIIEALPDRNKKRLIERQFKNNSFCPPSAIFTCDEVVAWYAARDMKIYSSGVKQPT